MCSVAPLSRGPSSEIFFVLPEALQSDLEIELTLAAAAGPVDVTVEVNDLPAGALEVRQSEPEVKALRVKPEVSRMGLNRVTLRYSETARISRRNREAAVRFHRMRLTRY